MKKKNRHIPVNILPEGACRGIMLMRDAFDGLPNSAEVERAHRDGGYTFIIQEEGSTHIEIDFQTHRIQAPAVIYLRQDQVHRVIRFEQALISTWIITEDNIRPEYLTLLNNFAPAQALTLQAGALSVLTDTVALCIRLSELKEEKLYNSILTESCNTLVALVASQYAAQSKPAEHYTRFEGITKAFKTALENNYKTVKNPSEYAKLLNISASYLNECVKATTGKSVTSHIQQRVMLEAKRLLYHADRSVKEIAGELGYDDYSYFTRLFAKVTGMAPIVFRQLNRE